MKLPSLITATSNWVGIDRSTVEACARALRASGRISVGGVGGSAADMTHDDALWLLFAACGCGTASKSGADAKGWWHAKRLDMDNSGPDFGFAFMREELFADAIRALLLQDLKADGALTRFIEESDAHAKSKGYPAHLHELTLSFEVDRWAGEIEVQRVYADEGGHIEKRERAFARFALTLDLGSDDHFLPLRDHHGFAAESKLVRQLGERNLRGWRRHALELRD